MSLIIGNVVHLFMCFSVIYVFFSYSSWGSQGKNTGVVCHSLFTGRTDAAAEAPILRSLDAKSGLTGNDPDARKDQGLEEEGMTEDEMCG